jgi:ABC-type Na+ transport system ATPase subunit NatA
LYVDEVVTLVPLKEKDYKLSTLGETKVGKKAAVGIKVTRKDHRDVNLFFDKDTGLLVKTETTIKDFMAGGQELNQETVMSDFKEIEGRKLPTKVVISRDGKKFVDGETSDQKYSDKLEDSVFAKP